MITLFALITLGPLGATPEAAGGFEPRWLRVPGDVGWVTGGDLDGDGRQDLVVSFVREDARRVGIFFRRPERGLPPRPDVIFRADSAAVFDVGNVDGSPGEELLSWVQSGVLAQSFAGRKPGRQWRLVSQRSVVGAVEPRDLVHWDFMRHFGPEGAPTLILPDFDRLHMFRSGGESGTWTRWATPRIDVEHFYDAESDTFRPSDDGGGYGNYAFRVLALVPRIYIGDQTGDARSDLVTFFEDQVAVFPVGADGALAESPAHRQDFALRTEEERRTGEAFVQSYVLDLDADGIADLCVRKNSGGLLGAKSRIQFHRGLEGGGFAPEPIQVMSDSGVASVVGFEDVDGDGRVELLVPRIRISVLSFIKAFTSRSVDIDVDILPPAEADDALFRTAPRQQLSTSLGLALSGGFGVRGTTPLFGHDFDLDGRRDVILAQGPERMTLHRGVEGDAYVQDPGFITLDGPGASTTVVLSPGEDEGPEVLVYYIGRDDHPGELLLFENRYTAPSGGS